MSEFDIERRVVHSLPYIVENKVYLVLDEDGHTASVGFGDELSAQEAMHTLAKAHPGQQLAIVGIDVVKYKFA